MKATSLTSLPSRVVGCPWQQHAAAEMPRPRSRARHIRRHFPLLGSGRRDGGGGKDSYDRSSIPAVITMQTKRTGLTCRDVVGAVSAAILLYRGQSEAARCPLGPLGHCVIAIATAWSEVRLIADARTGFAAHRWMRHRSHLGSGDRDSLGVGDTVLRLAYGGRRLGAGKRLLIKKR